MATSRNTGHRPGRPISRRALDRLSSPTRYDAVLAAIPLVFALGLAVHALAGVSLYLTVTGSAVTGVVLLVDAIYLNPPVDAGHGDPAHRE
jgi:hypothetical protein